MTSFTRFIAFVVLACTSSCQLDGQESITWSKLIPYQNTCPSCTFRKLLSDPNEQVLVVLKKQIVIDSPYHLQVYPSVYCYGLDGTLLWNQDFINDAKLPPVANKIGTDPIDAIVLPDATILLIGDYIDQGKSHCFFYHLSNTGDSLRFFVDTTLSHPKGVRLINTGGGQDSIRLFFVGEHSSTGDQYIYEQSLQIDQSSRVISMYSGFFGEWLSDTSLAVNSFYANQWQSLDVYDTNNILLASRQYGFAQKIVSGHPESTFLSISEDSIHYINHNLELIWAVDRDSVAPSGSDEGQGYSCGMRLGDKGFILGGVKDIDGLLYLSTLLKLDSQGQKAWAIAYAPSYLPLNEVTEVIEITDGLIIIGGIYSTGELWIVRLTSDGLLSSTLTHGSNDDFQFSFYPNPASEELTVNKPINFEGYATIIDLNGNKINKYSLHAGVSKVPCQIDIPNGTYFILVEDKKGSLVGSSKYIIVH